MAGNYTCAACGELYNVRRYECPACYTQTSSATDSFPTGYHIQTPGDKDRTKGTLHNRAQYVRWHLLRELHRYHTVNPVIRLMAVYETVERIAASTHQQILAEVIWLSREEFLEVWRWKSNTKAKTRIVLTDEGIRLATLANDSDPTELKTRRQYEVWLDAE